MKKEVALVYFVAGISSRFGGRMKQFVKIGPAGETLIEYSLSQSLKARFSKIIFVVGNKTEKRFRKKFGSSYKGFRVFYTLQKYDEKNRDKPWGTVDALLSAAPFLNCPFVVCNGDDIYGENTFKILVKHLRNGLGEATVGYKLSDVLPEKGATNRGILKVEGIYVKSIREVFDIVKSNLSVAKAKGGDLCSMGIFAFHPKTVKLLDRKLNRFKKQHKGSRDAECGLGVELSELIKAGKIDMKIYPAVDKWVGVTNPKDEKRAKAELFLIDGKRKKKF